MIYLLYFIHILICVFLILVVLLQQGKGADLAVFGGGSTQTAFGARSATTLLHKLTVGSFVMFILTTVWIGVLQGGGGGGSVMSDEPAAAPTAAPATLSTPPVTPPAAPADGSAPAPAPVEGSQGSAAPSEGSAPAEAAPATPPPAQ